MKAGQQSPPANSMSGQLVRPMSPNQLRPFRNPAIQDDPGGSGRVGAQEEAGAREEQENNSRQMGAQGLSQQNGADSSERREV